MLEQQLVKVQKPDEEQKKLAAIKDEGSAATPSPMKRLASDFEKKIKALPGDTSLLKDCHARFNFL